MPAVDELDALLADLARWTGEDRGQAAARARARERWLRQLAAEEARLAPMLQDLAERGAAVVVGTTAGPRLRGRVAAVATDFAVVVAPGGAPVTLVRLGGVATVRPDPSARPSRGHDRGAAPGSGAGSATPATLDEILAGLAAERPRVRLVVPGEPEGVTGELRAVGADVATVVLDGAPPASLHVRLGAVNHVTLL